MIFIQFLFMVEGVEPLEFNATSHPIAFNYFPFLLLNPSLLFPLVCPSCANCYELYTLRRALCVCLGR